MNVSGGTAISGAMTSLSNTLTQVIKFGKRLLNTIYAVELTCSDVAYALLGGGSELQ